nr:hypothetical protein [Desulfobulbaceae bacterium]
MKRKNLITFTMLMALLSLALIAQANLNQKNTGNSTITFDPQNHTYHSNGSISFLSQPIEQKYLTIKSINAIESRLETN